MPKVLLLTYDAESREPRRKDFEDAGFSVATEEPSWPGVLAAASQFTPDVIAVDCGLLPSHCRDTAEALRNNTATSGIPLVLFRVAEHEVERTRLKVPGGVVSFGYELVDRIRSAALTRLAHLAAQGPIGGRLRPSPRVRVPPTPAGEAEKGRSSAATTPPTGPSKSMSIPRPLSAPKTRPAALRSTRGPAAPDAPETKPAAGRAATPKAPVDTKTASKKKSVAPRSPGPASCNTPKAKTTGARAAKLKAPAAQKTASEKKPR